MTYSTNGHGPKRAVLYARVSTRQQAEEDRYSLPQQLAALREYCQREGYEVLEEITDPGYSGASLQRPGQDRVRDLVQGGGVSVVLAQDRDRFSREPAYLYILREEFSAHGTALRALNDHGDDSPEGQLTDGILDQIAKFERVKFAERSRRGLSQKVRQGKPIVTHRPPYGYMLADDGRLKVREEQMAVVRRILTEAADGQSVYSITQALNAEGIPSPTGRPAWSKTSVRFLLNSDLYMPHDHTEIAALVSPEVAATLDAEATYGLWAFNKRRTKTWNEPDGNGDYRKRYQQEHRSPYELLYAPVPDCGLPRSVVEAARRNVRSRARKPSGAARRFWELSGGIARCAECGSVLSPHTVISGDGKRRKHDYYSCRARYNNTAKVCANRHSNRAAELEALAWERVKEIVSDEDTIRDEFDSYAAHFRRTGSDESRARLMAQLEKLDTRRSAYQDQQTEGLINMEELRSKLASIEEERDAVRRELRAMSDDEELAREIEVLRDMLIEGSRMGYWQHVRTPQQRLDLYRRMGLKVEVDGDGKATLSGALLPGEAFVSEDSRRPPSSRRTLPPPR
jgi:site-specific DNA recombinase